MNTQQEYSDLQQDNEKLRLEIVQLQKDLDKEQFFHRTLYKQWGEIHTLILSKESELKLSRSTNLLYKYGFYLSLFLAAPAFYLLNSSKGDERITPASKAASSILITNETLTSNRDTLQVLNAKLDEKETIQPDASQPVPATSNDAVINKPLTDSVRNSIYWEGWSAYYEKSGNPYRNSSQKYEVWLEGWKKGESDSKKTLAKN